MPAASPARSWRRSGRRRGEAEGEALCDRCRSPCVRRPRPGHLALLAPPSLLVALRAAGAERPGVLGVPAPEDGHRFRQLAGREVLDGGTEGGSERAELR